MPTLHYEYFDTFWMKKIRYEIGYTWDAKKGVILDEFIYREDDGMELEHIDLDEPRLEEVYKACKEHHYNGIVSFPAYYRLGDTFYMLDDIESYVKVTCYEMTGGYGITSEVVIQPITVIEKGKAINQYDFMLAFTSAMNHIKASMKMKLLTIKEPNY